MSFYSTEPDVLIQDITAEWISSNETNEIRLTWRYGDIQIFFSDVADGEVFNETISNSVEYLIPDVVTGTTYDIELKSGSSSYLISVQTYEGESYIWCSARINYRSYVSNNMTILVLSEVNKI